MEKIIDIIKQLTFEELTELKNNLEKGEMKELVEQRLERFKNLNKVCPVCNTAVEEEGYTLIFGPEGLKKKATFDAIDCLEYFLYKMKK
ncbi:MAG: hypothetical protein ABH828_05650 [archaeon]